MENQLIQKIKANPNYQQLVKARTSYGWLFTALMLIVYYGFILLIAYDKSFLSQKIGAGVMTLGIPVGLFVIIFTVVITGIYVYRANGEFDELTAKIKEEVLK